MDANVIFESLLTTEGRSDPYPLYAALHRLGGAAVPVADAVIAHGYDAIDAVLRDPAFRVTDAARLDEVDPSWRDHPALGMDAILNLNPPDHSRIRAPMARAFTKRRVSGLGPSITRMTDELLDVMAERGADGSPVEFMHDFALQLPVTVICELLGIHEADRAGGYRASSPPWAQISRTDPIVSASSGFLSGRNLITRANLSARPPG
jgi:cytochrome P450